MPRIERPLTYSEAKPFINRPGVRILTSRKEPIGNHTEIVFEAQSPSKNPDLDITCSSCGNLAQFIQYSRDHLGQIFLTGTCVKHAPTGYLELREQKNSG